MKRTRKWKVLAVDLEDSMEVALLEITSNDSLLSSTLNYIISKVNIEE